MQRRGGLSYSCGIHPFPREESKCIATRIKNKKHELVMMEKSEFEKQVCNQVKGVYLEGHHAGVRDTGL